MLDRFRQSESNAAICVVERSCRPHCVAQVASQESVPARDGKLKTIIRLEPEDPVFWSRDDRQPPREVNGDALSVLEVVSILILTYSVCFLLPRDYRGQLRPAEETK